MKITSQVQSSDYADSLPEFVKCPNPRIYEEGVPLFLDFETTILDNGSALNNQNRLVLACWQLGWEGGVKHCWGSEYEQQDLLYDLRRADFIVAHNAKFELQWLERAGVDLHKVLVYDTMLAEYVIGGNRWMIQNLGLEKCLLRHGLPGKVSVVSNMISAGICPSEIPSEWLLEYCKRDVTALVDLMRVQLSSVRSTRLLPVIYSRCLLTPVLADIEHYGMKLDSEFVRTKYNELTDTVRRLEVEMNLLTGGINIASAKQRGVFLYETLKFPELRVRKGREWVPKRTESGAYATDGDTIAALRGTTDRQRRFLELYGELNDARQALSKYISKWMACVDENNGILQGSYNQTTTQTQRLSSSGAKYRTQMQNLPREYKPLFCSSDPDWVMADADGAQLEFRVAAHLGRDRVAYGDIRDGRDVHSFTAEVLSGAGQPTSRQDAKAHTFKPLNIAA